MKWELFSCSSRGDVEGRALFAPLCSSYITHPGLIEDSHEPQRDLILKRTLLWMKEKNIRTLIYVYFYLEKYKRSLTLLIFSKQGPPTQL